jgi:hypothetical protein
MLGTPLAAIQWGVGGDLQVGGASSTNPGAFSYSILFGIEVSYSTISDVLRNSSVSTTCRVNFKSARNAGTRTVGMMVASMGLRLQQLHIASSLL